MYPGDVFWERKLSIKIEISEIWLRRRAVVDGGWRLCGELDFFLVHRLPRQTDELSYDKAVYYNQIRQKRAAESWGAKKTLLNSCIVIAQLLSLKTISQFPANNQTHSYMGQFRPYFGKFRHFRWSHDITDFRRTAFNYMQVCLQYWTTQFISKYLMSYH